jgi:hypothetical protein
MMGIREAFGSEGFFSQSFGQGSPAAVLALIFGLLVNTVLCALGKTELGLLAVESRCIHTL